MIRNVFLFLGTFAVGALIALAVRAAAFKPHAGHAAHPAGGGDYAPMVTNTPAAPAAPGHAAHASPAPAQPAAAKTPMNSTCAICGMAVDPKLPTLEYQGKTVGFGCKMCVPKFQADPDRYGPLYLKNETVKR